MSILAVLGLTSLRGHMNKAETVEVRAAIKAITAAQERYRSEHNRYLDVSNDTLSPLYPMTSPNGDEYHFWGHGSSGSDPLVANWKILGPDISGPVSFGYATVAGLPTNDTTVYPDLALSGSPGWPATRSPWFVVQAIGDQDDDGTQAVAVATSFNQKIIWENEDE